MKALAIVGGQDQERKELLQSISTELIRRRYRVAQWQKSASKQHLDVQTTTITSTSEHSQIIWRKEFRLEDFLPHLQEDFLLLDFAYETLPRLSLFKDCLPPEDSYALAYIGKAHSIDKPVFQVPQHLSALVDFIVAETPDLLPYPDGNPCCKACGRKDCQEMLQDIIAHKATMDECVLRNEQARVELIINGFNLPLVQFVQDIISESCLGMLSTLNGYKSNSVIELRLKS